MRSLFEKNICKNEKYTIAVLRISRLPVHFLQKFPLVNRDLCKVFIRINFIINDPLFCSYKGSSGGAGGGQQENFSDVVEHNILADNTPVSPGDTQLNLPLYKYVCS